MSANTQSSVHDEPVVSAAALAKAEQYIEEEEGAINKLPGALGTMTTALAIHQLSLSAAKRAYPVHLRAVVTYFDPGDHLLFVQDASDGIFVELNEKEKGSMRAGDEVEVVFVRDGQERQGHATLTERR